MSRNKNTNNPVEEDDFEDIEVTKKRWEAKRRQMQEERSQREGSGSNVEQAKKQQPSASRHLVPIATNMAFGGAMGVAVGLSTGVIMGLMMGPAGQKIPMGIQLAKRQAMFFGAVFTAGGVMQYARTNM
jgi:hypothetical protein